MSLKKISSWKCWSISISFTLKTLFLHLPFSFGSFVGLWMIAAWIHSQNKNISYTFLLSKHKSKLREFDQKLDQKSFAVFFSSSTKFVFAFCNVKKNVEKLRRFFSLLLLLPKITAFSCRHFSWKPNKRRFEISHRRENAWHLLELSCRKVLMFLRTFCRLAVDFYLVKFLLFYFHQNFPPTIH